MGIMGKRSEFKRQPRDFYPTPFECVEPLIQHLSKNFTFTEPCAGDGALCGHLEHWGGRCLWASDLLPHHEGIYRNDYSAVGETELRGSDYIITNPPWDRKLLHPMIDHFRTQRDTWLLFDADWMHTAQSRPYMQNCQKIVSVGRVKWFGNMTGKDNCAWYLFTNRPATRTQFIGR